MHQALWCKISTLHRLFHLLFKAMLQEGHHYLQFSGWKNKGSGWWYDSPKITKLRCGRSVVKPRCVNSKDCSLSIIYFSFLPSKINEKFSNAIWNLQLNMKLFTEIIHCTFHISVPPIASSALERGGQKQHSRNPLLYLILGYSCQCGALGTKAGGWEMGGSHCCLEAATGRPMWTYRQFPGGGRQLR